MTYFHGRCALLLILATMIVTCSLAADITPDMAPTPGPKKITSTGKWSIAAGETAWKIRMIATPSGGGGGIGGPKYVEPKGDTYSMTVEDLESETEYDVILYLEYSEKGKDKAVYSQTYMKVKH